jgi:excinuclease UvrABC helicase subunit UvrB
VRFKCPFYTFENILASAGIAMDENDELIADSDDEQPESFAGNQLDNLSIEELEEELRIAVENEDYERASHLRDEITRRSNQPEN